MKRLIFISLATALQMTPETAFAVQPMPDGVSIAWERSTQPGWSNFSYSVWQYAPHSTNAVWLATTNGTNFSKSGPVLEGTMFGVSTIAQSNGVYYAGDVGIAPWPPLLGIGPNSVRITPTGGVAVEIGRWVNVSYDLKTNRESLRFHSGSNGTVRVEHRVAADRPYLFMTYPVPVLPPMPGGGR